MIRQSVKVKGGTNRVKRLLVRGRPWVRDTAWRLLHWLVRALGGRGPSGSDSPAFRASVAEEAGSVDEEAEPASRLLS